jgi:hypothetical protein
MSKANISTEPLFTPANTNLESSETFTVRRRFVCMPFAVMHPMTCPDLFYSMYNKNYTAIINN